MPQVVLTLTIAERVVRGTRPFLGPAAIPYADIPAAEVPKVEALFKEARATFAAMKTPAKSSEPKSYDAELTLSVDGTVKDHITLTDVPYVSMHALEHVAVDVQAGLLAFGFAVAAKHGLKALGHAELKHLKHFEPKGKP